MFEIKTKQNPDSPNKECRELTLSMYKRREERAEGFTNFSIKKTNRMPGADGPQYFMDQ